MLMVIGICVFSFCRANIIESNHHVFLRRLNSILFLLLPIVVLVHALDLYVDVLLMGVEILRLIEAAIFPIYLLVLYIHISLNWDFYRR